MNTNGCCIENAINANESEAESSLTDNVCVIDRDLNRLFPYLRKSGSDFMAYSTLQDGLEYFIVENVGYIAFKKFRHFILAPCGLNFVVADPIAEKRDFKQIISLFIKHQGPSIFLMITAEVALVLKEIGYQINQFGGAPEIDVQNFSMKGKEKDHLRRWRNKAIREGVTVVEEKIETVDAKRLKFVSDQWLTHKGGKEYKLMNRPFVYNSEPDVRYFFAYHNNRIVAVTGFDPMYENNRIIGYFKNVVRFSDDAPHGTIALATLTALEKFKPEGIQRLCMGISPFSNMSKDDMNDCRTMYYLCSFLYKHCTFIYPFQGNEFHKKRYGGVKKQFYYSTVPGRNKLFQLISALKVLNCF
jgi:phosphatidylglycerol lysyltransferase